MDQFDIRILGSMLQISYNAKFIITYIHNDYFFDFPSKVPDRFQKIHLIYDGALLSG